MSHTNRFLQRESIRENLEDRPKVKKSYSVIGEDDAKKLKSDIYILARSKFLKNLLEEV